MLTAQDVAEYFLWRAADQDDERLSNLKLQKLLYYAQGFSLAIFDKPLFSESVVAWVHGPVVVSLYHRYKEYGSGPIPPPVASDLSKYGDDTIALLEEVFAVFGQFAAWTLRGMTHSEPPWADVPVPGEITHDAMKRYFKTRLA